MAEGPPLQVPVPGICELEGPCTLVLLLEKKRGGPGRGSHPTDTDPPIQVRC